MSAGWSASAADFTDVTARERRGRALCRQQQQPADDLRPPVPRTCVPAAGRQRKRQQDSSRAAFPTQISGGNGMDEHTNRGGLRTPRGKVNDGRPRPGIGGQHAGAAAAPRYEMWIEAGRHTVAPRSVGSLVTDTSVTYTRDPGVYQQVTRVCFGVPVRSGHARPLATSRGLQSGSGWRPISFDASRTQLQGSGCTSPRLGRTQQNGFSDEDLLRGWASGHRRAVLGDRPIGCVVAISAASSRSPKKWDQRSGARRRGTVRQQQPEGIRADYAQGGEAMTTAPVRFQRGASYFA